MRPDIPRCDGDNPPSGHSSAPTAVAWWAWMGQNEPPLAVGRTPDEAHANLKAEILRHYQEDADPVPPDPEAHASAELARRRGVALLSGSADDEHTAFLAWRMVSSRTEAEAMRLWRRAFPEPGEGV